MSSSRNPSAECALCGEPLDSADSFHGIGATLTHREAVEKQEDGHMIGIEFEDDPQIVYALIAPPGSPAREKNHDLWFNLCSEDCARTLQKKLESDAEFISGTERPGESSGG